MGFQKCAELVENPQMFSLNLLECTEAEQGAAVAGTGGKWELAADRFSPVAARTVCLFSYLSSAVNQEKQRRER